MDNPELKRLTDFLKLNKVPAPDRIATTIMERVRKSKTQGNYRLISLNRSFAGITAAVLIAFITGALILMRPRHVTMTFILQYPNASSVSLAGDFNNWDYTSAPLSRSNEYWIKTIPLKPGQYEYVFVINGEQWIPDPHNDNVVESGFGGMNSVIEVQKI